MHADNNLGNGLKAILKIVKTKNGVKVIGKSLSKEIVMYNFCKNVSLNTLCEILKHTPSLIKKTDDFGNTMIHYCLAFNKIGNQTAGLKIMKLDKEVLLIKNNAGFDCIKIMEEFGLDEKSKSKISNHMIKKSLHDNANTSKKIRSRKTNKKVM